ncbi:hypothetical protein KM915_20830 [Cytobacillus oceanisediminis]|uniref:hypothetical protein n=1 Tax=Cytobacillus oceanisediminis TaxID=665099 RepID=UPI001C22D985|nr:hypothetical protein [Cytobacillus oceanisediminis]MBU8732496.1 hypothetical protein [Cytobacillus oceanisediminis]
MGTYYLYKSLTSAEERKVYRTKIIKQYEDKKKQIVEKNSESAFQKRLKETGINLSAVRFQIYRWTFLVITFLYYVFNIILYPEQYDRSILIIPLFFFVLTEPRLSFSLANIIVSELIKRKRKKRILELFTLFDILKADLNSLADEQEVNVYSILKESLPLFEQITGSVSRFLSLWKTSPDDAKNVFYQEIGGESAKVLGDVLYKLDQTSKKEALSIIESESSIFSYAYYEKEIQSGIKRKNGFFLLFSANILLIIAWLIFIVFTMFNDTINQNHFL